MALERKVFGSARQMASAPNHDVSILPFWDCTSRKRRQRFATRNDAALRCSVGCGWVVRVPSSASQSARVRPNIKLRVCLPKEAGGAQGWWLAARSPSLWHSWHFPSATENYPSDLDRSRNIWSACGPGPATPRPPAHGGSPVGQTRLLTETFQTHRQVSLDLPSTAELAEDAGEEFLRRFPPPLLVDEVQYAPKLFRHIKGYVDQHRDCMGTFLLSGSQKFQLMSHVSDSLAGRVAIVELHTLSASELEKFTGNSASGELLLDWMFRGGYPEIHARGLEPSRFYSDYVATYLERDVRTLAGVRNLRIFNRFLRLCATRTLPAGDSASPIPVSAMRANTIALHD